MDYNLNFVDIYQQNADIDISKINLSKYIKQHITYTIGDRYIKINKDELNYDVSHIKKNMYFIFNYIDDFDNDVDYYNIIIKNNLNNLILYDYLNYMNFRHINPIFSQKKYINFQIPSRHKDKFGNVATICVDTYSQNYNFEIYYKKMKKKLFLTNSILCGNIYNSGNIEFNDFNRNKGKLKELLNNQNYIDIHSCCIKGFLFDHIFDLNIGLSYDKYKIKITTDYTYNVLKICVNNIIKSNYLYNIIIYLIKYISKTYNITTNKIMFFLLYNEISYDQINYYIKNHIEKK